MKIVKFLEHSGLLVKGVTKTIENETKEGRRGLLSMLLSTLGAILLGNMSTDKGRGVTRAFKGPIEAGQDF